MKYIKEYKSESYVTEEDIRDIFAEAIDFSEEFGFKRTTSLSEEELKRNGIKVGWVLEFDYKFDGMSNMKEFEKFTNLVTCISEGVSRIKSVFNITEHLYVYNKSKAHRANSKIEITFYESI